MLPSKAPSISGIGKCDRCAQVHSRHISMNCPSCGQVVPDNSNICPHCSTSMAAPGLKESIQWEYEYFIFELTPNLMGPMRVKLGPGEHTLSVARDRFWRAYHNEILTAVQKWLDDGWQAVDEIGPADILLRTYTDVVAPGVLASIISILLTLIGLPFGPDFWPWRKRPEAKYAEPTRFRLKMRRPENLT